MQNRVQTQENDADLRHYIDVIIRRRWIILAIAVISLLSTSLYIYTATPIYQAKALVLIEKAQSTGQGLSDRGAVENTQADYYQTQYMLLKSYSLLEKVYTSLHLDKTDQFKNPGGIDSLIGAIKISPVRRSRLVHIKVDSSDPELAARISNTLATTYVKQNMENQLFISKEILEAVSVDPDSEEGRALHDSLPAVVNNLLIQNLKSELVQLQSKDAHLTTRYTEKHPERLSVESNIRSLTAQIRLETNKIVRALKTELSGQFKGNNVRIVDYARIPSGPYKPKKLQIVLIALLLGLIGGTGVALWVELLDQTIRTQEDVEERLQQPFLGIIPFLKRPEKSSPYAALLSKDPSLTGEAFRNLRTMTDFAHVSDSDRSILVTSTVQEEGKTYVATNLAVALTQLGGKVLIIDGDLRRPQIHKNFRLSSQRGISDFLAKGKDVKELESLIQKSDVPGLYVLPCGTRPPNPSELLNTPRMSALVTWAKENYDRVVVDCTPMFPIHDTLLWGRHIRTATFVVRYGKTNVQIVQSGIRRLLDAGVKVAGITINAASTGGLTYANYGYYYQQYYRPYAEETVVESK